MPNCRPQRTKARAGPSHLLISFNFPFCSLCLFHSFRHNARHLFEILRSCHLAIPLTPSSSNLRTPPTPPPPRSRIARPVLPSPENKRRLVQTKASLSNAPIHVNELMISPTFRCETSHGSYIICYHVVPRLVLRIVLTLTAASPNSRSPLVAVDTWVEHRTGEQKTIGPIRTVLDRLSYYLLPSHGCWGIFGP